MDSKKAVFLDRDGTINVDKGFVHRVEDFEFLPGVIDGLKLLQNAGFLLIIITNQSGIARGFYTEQDFEKLNNWMLCELAKYKIRIAGVYYCPHLPLPLSMTYSSISPELKKYRIECNCRKPNLSLFERAIKDFNIDISKSYAIGDKIRDCSICEIKGCKGFLIMSRNITNVINKKVRIVQSLMDAARLIITENTD